MKLKSSCCILLLLFLGSFTYGQMNRYEYKRELQGIETYWHRLILPGEVFGKVSADLNDIRIYGINSTGDTIEASYVLQLKAEKIVRREVNFRLLNTSSNTKGYFYTLEVPAEQAVNQLYLEFNKQNFDWQLRLEGSHDQKEWFTVVEDDRILSIKNTETDYQYTKVIFPDTKYRFFRLQIKSNENPDLSAIKAVFEELITGRLNSYELANQKTITEKKKRQTIHEVQLRSAFAVSTVQLKVNDTFDYYRPVTIEYVSDSIKTELGWKYRYLPLTSGTLSSLEQNELRSESTILKKLKITIADHDNMPLTLESVVVKGYVHELLVRFTEKATYFLVYGNKDAGKPNYDIEQFVSKVPDTVSYLNLSEEQKIDKKDASTKKPLFRDKRWLWLLMGIIIFVLGWFSLRMIRRK